MNTNTVTDGQLGQLAVKQHELFQRAKKGVYASFDEMLDALQQIIERKTPIIPMVATIDTNIFRLTVDDKSLEQMIADGHYDWTNDDITVKRFLLRGHGVVEVEQKLFHFDEEEDIESDEAKWRIGEDGWEVARIEDLLAFGGKHPDEQRKYPIIALGSVARVDGHHFVAYLGRDDTKRYLDLGWWGRRWDRSCRFLAVRKVSGA